MKATVFVLLGLVSALFADTTILKKDGTSAVAKSLRRQGDNIIATMEMTSKPGDPVTTGDIGIPIAQIQKIEFPEPAVLKNAQELLVQGKPDDALAQVESGLKYYEAFRDAPGSWWGDLALQKMNILVMLGREKEADSLAESVSRQATDPETQRGAKVLLAAAATRAGNIDAAGEALDSVLKDATKDDVLASAAIYKGQNALAQKDWENALLAFLQIPVLYPGQKQFAAASLLGVGRAHLGLDDFGKARITFRDVMKLYPGTPEATAAKSELDVVAKRERAMAAPR